MSRRRDRKGLQVSRGERYALLPVEMLTSDAYRAVPHYATRVLTALTAQYYGTRNGSLALPWSDAQQFGITTQAQLYGGLRVLEAADLVLCTRRGHLTAGKQLASMYALTWKGIDEPAEGVVYDAGVSVSPMPSNAWARWSRPADWDDRVRQIAQRAKGKLRQKCPYPSHSVTPRGETAAHPVGSGNDESRSPRGESDLPIPAHPVGVTSEISALGQDDSHSSPPSGSRSESPSIAGGRAISDGSWAGTLGALALLFLRYHDCGLGPREQTTCIALALICGIPHIADGRRKKGDLCHPW